MNASNPFIGRRFFGRFGSRCAPGIMMGVMIGVTVNTPALAQSPGSSATPSKSTSSTKSAGSAKTAGPSTSPPKGTPVKPISAPKSQTSQDPNNRVNVSSYGNVDLAVQDTQLSTVLEMLAIHSQKNIIVNKNVSASVTAYLYDVTFNEALDAILRPNGYGYIEEGNFVYIYTIDELAEIEKKNRKTEARIFNLDHLSAEDAKECVTPLLSSDGKAAFRGDVAKGIEPKIADLGANEYAFNTKMVVNDYPDNLDRIAALLADIDTPPDQVLVESTILQTVVDEKNAWGIDFSVLADINFTDLISPLAGVTNLLNGSDTTNGVQPADNRAGIMSSTVGNTGGPGGFKLGVVTDDIAVFLRVLDEVTDSTVLARPKIMALNRQRAQVLVGAKVGYLSTTATETTTTQSVEFLDTGIKLVFRPFISKDGSIRLELAPSVSEASLRTVTDSNGLQVTIPDQLTNELKTNVRIRDGQTLVLGGLFKESTRINRRQLPFIGDIPILGAPFRGQDDTVRKDEIIFLITPSVVREDVQAKAGRDAMAYAETARIGMRAGLLPFSRELMTSNYNQDAIDAYNRGDIRKARWYANMSLGLNPNQPEVTRLRDQINGVPSERAHERSILERAWHPDLVLMRTGMSAGVGGEAALADGTTGSTGTFHVEPDGTSSAEIASVTTSDFTGTEGEGSTSPHTTGPDTPTAAEVEISGHGSSGSHGATGSTGTSSFDSPRTHPSANTPAGIGAGSDTPSHGPTSDEPSTTDSFSFDSTSAATYRSIARRMPADTNPHGVAATGHNPAFGFGPASTELPIGSSLSPEQRLSFDWLMSQMFVQWRIANGLPPVDLDRMAPICPPDFLTGTPSAIVSVPEPSEEDSK